ncbi:hypothetical protein REH65_33365 (plasmid) [Saccharopolyspora sp. ID03-671]|uniref:hypothetical protein n=1 Tax=Saccharopolyspora sp. ID03-671 TaxID=3073066 RepID=UPI0030F3E2E1
MSAELSIADIVWLESVGVDGVTVAAPRGPERSEWAPERILQAAADGAMQVYGLDELEEVVTTWIDGRPVTQREQEHITDLVASDHLVLVGNCVALTARGRATLRTWSKYRPCHRREGGERS